MGFGSGIVVPGFGVSLQNRGAGFSSDPRSANVVAPGNHGVVQRRHAPQSPQQQRPPIHRQGRARADQHGAPQEFRPIHHMPPLPSRIRSGLSDTAAFKIKVHSIN
jgi:hypothetical protein